MRARRRFVVGRVGDSSVRMHRRSLRVGTALAVLVAAAAAWSLTLGDYGLTMPESFARLRGLAGAEDDWLGVYFVQQVRAPRALAAVLVCMSLGVSGRLFQTVSGNPLGSPDVVGFSTGAATGAIVAIILLGAGPAITAVGAIIGGLLTGVAVTAAAGGAGTAGMRLILIGIGTSAVLRAVNSLLLVKAPLEVSQAAQQWSAGSLHGTTWPYVWVLGAITTGCVLFLMAVARPLELLPLGDDAATALGASARRSRAVAVVVGLILVSAATAVAGPVAFVALATPHIAQRLTRGPGAGLTTSALVGGALVALADVVAQRAIAPAELAMGVITGTLGGVYLLVLLLHEYRRNAL